MSEEIEQKYPTVSKATGTLLGAPVAKEQQYIESEVVKPKKAGLSSKDQLLQQGGLANAIVSEHEHFRQLFEAFKQCRENERDRKWNIMQELIEDISSHSSAECRTLYPEFYGRVPDAKLHYDKLLTDDQVNLDILAFLDQHKPTNSNDWCVWEETCVKFFNIEELHMQDEENKVLPKLLSVLSIAESNALADKFRDKKSTAPLKPHPSAPITEMAATVTHPIQGAIDRMAAGIKNLMGGTTY